MPTTISGNSITTTGDINSTTTGTAGALVGRNKIIGGDFSTNPWQRGTSFTAPASGAYTVDRFKFENISAAVVNILRSLDAPTAAQAGVFTQHCLHVDVTTADTTIAATDITFIEQKIEGINAAAFGFGQPGTRFVTLSFWHKHTKTGVYCVALRNAAGNRSYVVEYSQDVSDAWEFHQMKIPVDTTGAWLYDNGIGLQVGFTLATGTNFQTTANTWQTGNFLATANQVNALDNVNNNFKIALVQLEAGEVATDFEALDVGTVLARCQRYYEQGPGAAIAFFQSTTAFKLEGRYLVQKRAPATVSFPTTGLVAQTMSATFASGANTNIGTITASVQQENTKLGFTADATNSTAAPQTGFTYIYNTVIWTASAEL